MIVAPPQVSMFTLAIVWSLGVPKNRLSLALHLNLSIKQCLSLKPNYSGCTCSLRNWGVALDHASMLWCDNVNTLTLASNPVFHTRTKHIEVDYHFVSEKVINGDILIKFISTHYLLLRSTF
jgi:hypothetical protein